MIRSKRTEQRVLWVPGPQFGRPAQPVLLDKKPDRVWTLIPVGGSPDVPPQLPIQPQHLHNAFLEDYVHDWNWKGGKFRYYSRVTGEDTWLLLEYEV